MAHNGPVLVHNVAGCVAVRRSIPHRTESCRREYHPQCGSRTRRGCTSSFRWPATRLEQTAQRSPPTAVGALVQDCRDGRRGQRPERGSSLSFPSPSRAITVDESTLAQSRSHGHLTGAQLSADGGNRVPCELPATPHTGGPWEPGDAHGRLSGRLRHLLLTRRELRCLVSLTTI